MSAVQELARRLFKLEKRVLAGPQLHRSAIETGSIKEYDGEQLVGVIGKQYDGTHGHVTVAGPNPPTPTGITAVGVPGGVLVRWDGSWEPIDDPTPGQAPTPAVAPMDLRHLEVHASDEAGYSALLFETLKTYMVGQRGGEVIVSLPPDVDYWIRLVARSTSGKVGPPSDAVGPVKAGKVRKSELDIDFSEFGGSTIFYGPDQPVTDKADVWLRTPTEGDTVYTLLRYDPFIGEWVELSDQSVAQAIIDAAEANDKAVEAGNAALAASTAAGQAQGTANQASTAAQAASTAAGQAQTTANNAQTAAGQASTAAGAAQGTANTAVANALTAQQTAEAAANVAAGKTATFRQDAQPATTGRTTGDQWYETDQGNRLHVWSGSAWVLTQLGASAISATARQLGAITVLRQATEPTTGIINGDFWIRSTDNLIHIREAGAWVASRDTAINAAVSAAATAQATADGKARIFLQPAEPAGLTAADLGDTWVDIDNQNLTYTWNGTLWEPRRIGTGSIIPNSLIASDVVATGTITAALLEAVLVLASTIVAGNPQAARVVMDAAGLRAYNVLGEETFRVEATTGGVTMRGTFVTQQGDDSIVIAGAMWENRPGIVFRNSKAFFTDPTTGTTNNTRQSAISTASASNPSSMGMFSGRSADGKMSAFIGCSDRDWTLMGFRYGPTQGTDPTMNGYIAANDIQLRTERNLTPNPTTLFPQRPLNVGLDRTSLNAALKRNFVLAGGGRKVVNMDGCTWNKRMYIINQGDGNHNIPPCPPNGTVIKGWGGRADVTVTNGFIPMAKGDSVYFITGYNSMPENNRFIITGDSPDSYALPLESVLICSRSFAESGGSMYHWGTGDIDDPWRPLSLINGWIPYGEQFLPPAYKKIGSRTYVRGLIKGGVATLGTVMAYIDAEDYGPPSGFRVGLGVRTLIRQGRVDVFNGNLDSQAWIVADDVDTAFVFLDGLSWDNF